MTRHLAARLVATFLLLAALSEVAPAQLPVREPSVTRDPALAPPLPATEPVPVPQPTVQPQPAVQPGTILSQPVLRPAQELRYLPAGEPPGAVQVTATGPETITLSWTAPPGATGYWIHQAVAGATTYYRGGSLVTGAPATVTALRPATGYSFKVSAVYPQEMQRAEGMSAAVSATTAAAPVPTGLAAAVTGRGEVGLSWNALPGADGLRLLRNDSTLKDIKPVNYAGGSTLATTLVDSVMPGTHRYQLQAVYRASGLDQGADVLSAPTPAVTAVIPASSRVRFCQP